MCSLEPVVSSFREDSKAVWVGFWSGWLQNPVSSTQDMKFLNEIREIPTNGSDLIYGVFVSCLATTPAWPFFLIRVFRDQEKWYFISYTFTLYGRLYLVLFDFIPEGILSVVILYTFLLPRSTVNGSHFVRSMNISFLSDLWYK